MLGCFLDFARQDSGTMGIRKQGATDEERIIFLEGLERKKTASLLFFGAAFGLLGFLFAFIIGTLKFLRPLTGEYHRIFPSGHGYFPATVSEMVHDPTDPAGKCFFAFEFVGAFFIFNSWYPWSLRNVYIGDDDQVAPCVPFSWMMFRQFIPPAGMMLVATVTTTPFAQAAILDYFCISIHLFGAVLLFAGYGVVEAKTLGWCGLQQPIVAQKCVGEDEKTVRKRLLTGLVAWYVLFCVLQGVLLLPLDQFGGKNDHWETRKIQNPTAEPGELMSQTILIDTASGFVLGLKILSYASEVCCGLFLIMSFMTIWWFCAERKADLRDELYQVQDSNIKQV